MYLISSLNSTSSAQWKNSIICASSFSPFLNLYGPKRCFLTSFSFIFFVHFICSFSAISLGKWHGMEHDNTFFRDPLTFIWLPPMALWLMLPALPMFFDLVGYSGCVCTGSDRIRWCVFFAPGSVCRVFRRRHIRIDLLPHIIIWVWLHSMSYCMTLLHNYDSYIHILNLPFSDHCLCSVALSHRDIIIQWLSERGHWSITMNPSLLFPGLHPALRIHL